MMSVTATTVIAAHGIQASATEPDDLSTVTVLSCGVWASSSPVALLTRPSPAFGLCKSLSDRTMSTEAVLLPGRRAHPRTTLCPAASPLLPPVSSCRRADSESDGTSSSRRARDSSADRLRTRAKPTRWYARLQSSPRLGPAIRKAPPRAPADHPVDAPSGVTHSCLRHSDPSAAAGKIRTRCFPRLLARPGGIRCAPHHDGLRGRSCEGKPSPGVRGPRSGSSRRRSAAGRAVCSVPGHPRRRVAPAAPHPVDDRRGRLVAATTSGTLLSGDSRGHAAQRARFRAPRWREAPGTPFVLPARPREPAHPPAARAEVTHAPAHPAAD